VVVREGQPGVKQIVGYVVGAADHAQLREHAAATLPEYMVPTAFVTLDVLPVSPNGKLDRKALPAPNFAAAAGDGGVPSTPTEEVLCELFRAVLGVPTVGVRDSFFDLGGDSIVSIQLVSRAKAAGLLFSPKDVFERKTVEQLAAVADRITATGAVVVEDPDAGTGDLVPLPVTRELRGPIAGFHQSALVRVPAGLRRDHLVAALTALVDHHDALRLRLLDRDPLRLAVQPRGSVEADRLVTAVDVIDVPDPDLARVIEAHDLAARARLHPETGAVLQAVWFDAGPDRAGRLLLLAHHLVVDGVSWRILLPDLALAHQAASRGEPIALDPVGTSYRTWGRTLTELAGQRAAELPRWTEVLAAPDTPLADRPLDPRTDVVATAREVRVTLPPEVTEPLLTSAPATFHANPQDVLLTALAAAVARRHPGHVLVDLEGHGRQDDVVPGTDLARTVGWFTTLYPTRLDLAGLDLTDLYRAGPDAGRALKRVKEQLRALPDTGLGFGLLRHLNPDTAPTLAALPRPQLGFNYLGRFGTASGGDWQNAPERPGIGGGADPGMALPHSIEITAFADDTAAGPVLTASWLFPATLLAEPDVQALADDWVRALRALVEHAAHPEAGGHTPSDLTLVSLSQDEIDEFEDDLRAEWEMSK
jgi:non-ribosomal peptide synthase protein (TIGR01720 family)